MTKTPSKPLVGWLLVALLLIPASVNAQESRSKDDNKSQKAESQTDIEPIKVQRDPAFDRYVNMKLLNQAIASLDPELLTDVAMQFVQGERVLFRSHKSITAEEVLGLAVRIASEKQDKEALVRLAQAIDQHGSKELTTRVKLAQQLASASRAADPALMVSVDRMTPEAFAAYQRILKLIEANKLRADIAALLALRERLPDMHDLGEQERQYAERLIDEALESVPEGGSTIAEKLALLSEVSRSSSPLPRVAIDQRIYGIWLDGRHVHAVTKSTNMKAGYALKPAGQQTIKSVLEATDKDGIYRMKTGKTQGIFVKFTFTDNGNEVKVRRYDGKKYVDYGKWKKKGAVPRTKTASAARPGK